MVNAALLNFMHFLYSYAANLLRGVVVFFIGAQHTYNIYVIVNAALPSFMHFLNTTASSDVYFLFLFPFAQRTHTCVKMNAALPSFMHFLYSYAAKLLHQVIIFFSIST